MPRRQWDAATWILVAIGHAVFQKQDFAEAGDVLQEVMHCPGGIGNPFLHLRLGRVQLELKNLERAKDELARAYMRGGDELFEGGPPA